MCMVSMIGDYYHPRQWGTFPQRNWHEWELEQMQKLRDMYEKAKEMNKAIGEKDCENPDTKEVLKQILDRLDKLEKGINKSE